MFGLSASGVVGGIIGILIAVAPAIWWGARLDQRVGIMLGLLRGQVKKQKSTEIKVQALHTVQTQHAIVQGEHALRIEKLEARAG